MRNFYPAEWYSPLFSIDDFLLGVVSLLKEIEMRIQISKKEKGKKGSLRLLCIKRLRAYIDSKNGTSHSQHKPTWVATYAQNFFVFLFFSSIFGRPVFLGKRLRKGDVNCEMRWNFACNLISWGCRYFWKRRDAGEETR